MISNLTSFRYSFSWFALIAYIYFLVLAAVHFHDESFISYHEVSVSKFVPNSDPYADEFQNCKIVQTFYSQLNSKSNQNNFACLTNPDNVITDFGDSNAIQCYSGLTLSPRSPPSV